MRLDTLRRQGKRALSKSPVFYSTGRLVFVYFRELMDHVAFKLSFRDVPYIHYSRRRLSQMKHRGYRSQYGQDYYLWTTILKRSSSGFFVDIGGNHPVDLSNSYFLEQRGWTGLAFDPLSQFEPAWRELRSARFNRIAIAATETTRDFIEIQARDGWEHTLSGFRDFVRQEDMDQYGFLEYPVECSTISRYVNSDQHVDLVLIDVEGAERGVIAGLDLEHLRPDFLMVENVVALGGDAELRKIMFSYGYALIARIGSADDIFELSKKESNSVQG
jgi:FkbM family methyltransferase